MKHGLKVLLACLLVATCSLRAQAAATLTLYDGINPLIAVADNGPGDQIGSTGLLFVSTNVGVWILSINIAVTKPVFGSTTDPIMSLQMQATSTAGGSLRAVFSDNGFGPASGTLNATVDGHVVSGAPVNLAYDVWGDPANVVGATTVHITSTGIVALPVSRTDFGLLALPTPFSLTQILQFDSADATSISANASFNVTVPEPGILSLGALGLGALALRRVGRK